MSEDEGFSLCQNIVGMNKFLFMERVDVNIRTNGIPNVNLLTCEGKVIFNKNVDKVNR